MPIRVPATWIRGASPSRLKPIQPKRPVVTFLSGVTNVEFNHDFASTIMHGEDLIMGDKGGKKDKDKSKKQQTAKQQQKVKGAQEKNKPKG